MLELTNLIRQDMKPALGVTEPGAIAFAVATAKKYVAGPVKQIKVLLNSGMYKNAFTCGIPSSSEVGNVFAAALGFTGGNAKLGLEALAEITEEQHKEAEALVAQGKVKVMLDHIGSRITIDAIVETQQDICTVKIAGSHTAIYRIIKNEEVILEQEEEAEAKNQIPVIHQYTLEAILNYIEQVPAEELEFIQTAFDMNMELLEEGLQSDRTIFGPSLYQSNAHQLCSDDPLKTAQLWCNGAIEARVLGLNRPAMSITGSGAHGIIATLPLYAYYKVCAKSTELLLRATALSYLITMYIKEYSGKLSAFCGCGIAAGTGMACGLCYMQGGTWKELAMVVQNMASGLTGMICDGGNQGCVMKGIVAVDAAFRSVDLAMQGICIDACHGINGKSPEETMKNMGLIASPGMVQTEETIVHIMEGK